MLLNPMPAMRTPFPKVMALPPRQLPLHPRATVLLARRRNIAVSTPTRDSSVSGHLGAEPVSPSVSIEVLPFFTTSASQASDSTTASEPSTFPSSSRPPASSNSTGTTSGSDSSVGHLSSYLVQGRAHAEIQRETYQSATGPFSFFPSSSPHLHKPSQGRSQAHDSARLAISREGPDLQESQPPNGQEDRDPHRLVSDREWELRVGRGILHLRTSLPRFFRPSSGTSISAGSAGGAAATTEEMWPADVFSKEVRLELPPPLPVKVSLACKHLRLPFRYDSCASDGQRA